MVYYPLYDFAHPLSDAIEKITHSICTLEFEDHRPIYNWVVKSASFCGFLRIRFSQDNSSLQG